MGRPRAPREPLAARRVGLDLAGLVVLRRAALAAGLPDLPVDVVHDPGQAAPDLGGAQGRLLDEAAARLRAAGVLDEDGHPVPAVAANLAAVAAAPRRLHVSLAGSGASLVAHHWVDAELGGSLVRDGRHGTLTLHDARLWGDEVRRHLPDPEGTGPAVDADGCTVPGECWAALAGTADPQADLDADPGADVVARLAGTEPEVVERVTAWARDVRAVLHVSVPPPPTTRTTRGGERAAYAVVRFLGSGCWWSARPGRAPDGSRTVTLHAVDRDEVGTALGALVAEGWALDGGSGT